MIGKTILHYKILEKLGEGGMGVVYKAEDTKLERRVALKFLSLTSISDEEKKRFKREAKAAASLNHPNIATVFAIDEAKPAPAEVAEAGDQTFIAMEFIEGKSLEHLINSPLEGGAALAAGVGRPLLLDDAINYATQIAAGLQAAHEKGITHRDIKSANIMVTDKGQIKIMDFGLAKLANRSKLTQLGTTLGTAAYMSPEQSRGEEADHRSDIWSLGVLLYEMISGQMPFKGDYEQAVIYSIQNEEPEPLTALRSAVPIALDGIIAKALAKDPDTRYQHVDELPADLKALDTALLSQSRISTKETKLATHFQSAWQMRLPWAVAGLMTFLAAAGLWYGWRTNTGDRLVSGIKRATLQLTPSEGLVAGRGRFALSPDGRMLVFEGRSGENSQLFLRHLNKEEAIALAGTEDGGRPFFSPDGKWIGFRTQTKLKKVSVDGGAPREICDATAQAASWGAKDVIVFSQRLSERSSVLMRVSAQGGLPEPLQTDESEARGWYAWPEVLPDGRHVLFTSVQTRGAVEEASIMVLSIEGGERRTLIRGGTKPHYVPTGQIIYARSRTLIAVPFDLESLTITGPSSPLAEEVSTNPSGDAVFAVSMDGTLVYLSQDETQGELVWVDRQGGVATISAPAHDYWDPRLSPDGRRVAVQMRDNGNEIWVFELARGTLTRLTFNPSSEPVKCGPFFASWRTAAVIPSCCGRATTTSTSSVGQRTDG